MWHWNVRDLIVDTLEEMWKDEKHDPNRINYDQSSTIRAIEMMLINMAYMEEMVGYDEKSPTSKTHCEGALSAKKSVKNIRKVHHLPENHFLISPTTAQGAELLQEQHDGSFRPIAFAKIKYIFICKFAKMEINDDFERWDDSEVIDIDEIESTLCSAKLENGDQENDSLEHSENADSDSDGNNDAKQQHILRFHRINET
ncbi:Hypothetical predicted protein [Paramuricea clavata]|uniref:Uncharacterized protein n=1 Tax=Paramuricea clavata TaxID=317549 RepID=A0A7D9I2Y1_PARCT|nr:Hypothetical predicted protein [Paramuricea clavata]